MDADGSPSASEILILMICLMKDCVAHMTSYNTSSFCNNTYLLLLLLLTNFLHLDDNAEGE